MFFVAEDVAVGQHQWYHFGVGAPPILVYFSGDWDVHWGYGLLTHGHVWWGRSALGIFSCYSSAMIEKTPTLEVTFRGRLHGSPVSVKQDGTLSVGVPWQRIHLGQETYHLPADVEEALVK